MMLRVTMTPEGRYSYRRIISLSSSSLCQHIGHCCNPVCGWLYTHVCPSLFFFTECSYLSLTSQLNSSSSPLISTYFIGAVISELLYLCIYFCSWAASFTGKVRSMNRNFLFLLLTLNNKSYHARVKAILIYSNPLMVQVETDTIDPLHFQFWWAIVSFHMKNQSLPCCCWLRLSSLYLPAAFSLFLPNVMLHRKLSNHNEFRLRWSNMFVLYTRTYLFRVLDILQVVKGKDSALVDGHKWQREEKQHY